MFVMSDFPSLPRQRSCLSKGQQISSLWTPIVLSLLKTRNTHLMWTGTTWLIREWKPLLIRLGKEVHFISHWSISFLSIQTVNKLRTPNTYKWLTPFQYVTRIIIWLDPRAGKMSQSCGVIGYLREARWALLACFPFPVLGSAFKRYLSSQTLSPLVSCW